MRQRPGPPRWWPARRCSAAGRTPTRPTSPPCACAAAERGPRLMPASVLDRIPGGYQLYAAAVALRRRVGLEWSATPLRHLLLAGPRPAWEASARSCQDLRPADPEAGRRILAGAFTFEGETVLAHRSAGRSLGTAQPQSPLRRRPARLCLAARTSLRTATRARCEALRLDAWRGGALFGSWNIFSWEACRSLSAGCSNLACNIAALSRPASEAEAERAQSRRPRPSGALPCWRCGICRSAPRNGRPRRRWPGPRVVAGPEIGC